MRVLLTGAGGFLGSAVGPALARAGHRVVAGVHRRGSAAAGVETVLMDYRRDFDVARWWLRLRDVDAVINAVGIFRETRGQTFEAVHVRAPKALFQACAEAGVRRVVQVSALGADADATTAFHLSKREADAFLLQLPVSGVVVQPSLVYGESGASTRLFQALATLPVIPLPGDGRQRIQPVHVADVAQAIVSLLDSDWRGVIPLVGAESTTLRDYLGTLRSGMGLGAPRFMETPAPLMRLATATGLADRDALAMLERGNVADVAPMRSLLGAPPRAPREFISPHRAAAIRQAALLAWLTPPLRWSIALVWLVAGVVSAGLYPVTQSYAMLAQAGVPPAWQALALFGAAVLDIVLGLAIFFVRHRAIWWVQAAVILAYTAIVSIRLPEYWLHPFGPIVKNLPLLAAIALLGALEPRR